MLVGSAIRILQCAGASCPTSQFQLLFWSPKICWKIKKWLANELISIWYCSMRLFLLLQAYCINCCSHGATQIWKTSKNQWHGLSTDFLHPPSLHRTIEAVDPQSRHYDHSLGPSSRWFKDAWCKELSFVKRCNDLGYSWKTKDTVSYFMSWNIWNVSLYSWHVQRDSKALSVQRCKLEGETMSIRKSAGLTIRSYSTPFCQGQYVMI